jgi:hypothetical protein
MIQDDASTSAQSEGKEGAQKAPEIQVNPPSSEPEETPPPQVIKPAVSEDNSNTDSRTDKDKGKIECPAEISVRIVKEDVLNHFERHSLILSWITLLTLIATFVVFALQLKEAKRQTIVFRRQAEQATADANLQSGLARQALIDEQKRFVQDQRPYVWYSTTELPTITADQTIYWSFHYVNYGRSPAIGLRGQEQVVFGKNRDNQIKKGLFSSLHNGTDRSGMTLPPNKDEYTTAHSLTKPNADEVKFVLDNDDATILLAFFEYFDLQGNKYTSRICLQRLKSGAVANCDNKYTELQ